MPEEQQTQTAQPATPQVVASPQGVSWSKIIITVIVIVVVTALIAGAYWYFVLSKSTGEVDTSPIKVSTPSTKKATSSATPSAKKDETANWKTYENKKDGYSIKYPESYSFVSANLLPANSIEIRSQNYKEQTVEGTRYMKNGISLSITLAFPKADFTGDIDAYKSSAN